MCTVVCILETIVMQHTDSMCGGYMEDWEGDKNYFVMCRIYYKKKIPKS